LPNPWDNFADIAAAESDVAWSSYLVDETHSSYESAKANSVGTFTADTSYDTSALAAIIKSRGGKLEVTAANPVVEFAKSHWWQFSVQTSIDGQAARITENNLLLYGGLGVGALILFFVLQSR
jgi:hypothetical protein